jgi:intermembrane space import and assembly protein 40
MDEAIDPVTGDINWNCECLGNNAKGPCGEIFKKAFTAYVQSLTDPEIKCEELILEMQTCFSQYPDLYSN